jgi:hypothetical protein
MGSLKEEANQVPGMTSAITRQGNELTETCRQTVALGGRVQQLEGDSQLLRGSSAGLKAHLARVEAGQQSAVARLQDAIAAGGSKVNEDLGNVQREVAKLKGDMIVTRRMAGKRYFTPFVKKGKRIDVPDGIIAHLTRECGGNVHDRHVVDVTCGSFEKETHGANPHSGAFCNDPWNAAKNVADVESNSRFLSAHRKKEGDIPSTRNNWICYNFKERRIVPTHYTIRTKGDYGPGGCHLKSWLVETSGHGENWREVAREEDNEQLNGADFTATFAVAGGGECRFIRLVNIGRNYWGDDQLQISAWEIFGNLIE